MPSNVTRREVTILLAATTAASLAAQTAVPGPRTPQQELEAAREQAKRTSAQLGSVALPMESEPDFVFKP